MSLPTQSQEQLRSMIATMLMVSPAEVADGTSLASLNTSLGAAKVRLGLKRLGLALPANAKPATFGGLLSALSGEAQAVPIVSAPKAAPPVVSNGSLQVGLDVEEIHALPVATDYWEHDFYRGSFSKPEIAYAVLQAEPRTHFAGFWCAKEALRKCDTAFANVSPDKTAIAHEANGRPYLTLDAGSGPERLPHAVSISHTTDVATGIVVSGSAAPEAVVQFVEPVIAAEIIPERRKSRGLAKLFGI
jgi:phosphopantetheine--protein transferase-like protein